MGRSAWPLWAGIGGGLIVGAIAGVIAGRDSQAQADQPKLRQLAQLQSQYHQVTSQLATASAALQQEQAAYQQDQTTIHTLTQQVQTLTAQQTQLQQQITTLQHELAQAEIPVYSWVAAVSTMPVSGPPGPANTYATGTQWVIATCLKNGRPIEGQTVSWQTAYPPSLTWLYQNNAGSTVTQPNGQATIGFPDVGGSVTITWTDPAGQQHTQTLAFRPGLVDA